MLIQTSSLLVSFLFFCFDHDEIKKKRTRHDQLAIGIILVVGMTQDDV